MSTRAQAPARDLVSLLLVSLEQLAGAGEVESACRLAGQACALLRHDDEQAAQRFNSLLHRLVLSPAYRTQREREAAATAGRPEATDAAPQ